MEVMLDYKGLVGKEKKKEITQKNQPQKYSLRGCTKVKDRDEYQGNMNLEGISFLFIAILILKRY